MKSFVVRNIQFIAWCTLVVAVLFSVFARTPFGFLDEQVHYIRAIGVGSGQFLSYSNSKKDSSHSSLGHTVDSSNLDYINDYIGKGYLPVKMGWIKSPQGNSTDTGKRIFAANTSAAPYTPVPYISYGVASKISEKLNLNMKTELILMRLFGAITALGIIFLAYKAVPKKYKWTILAVSLVPMSIAAFAAITTDGFTIAAALLFMANLLRVVDKIQHRTLARKDMVWLSCATLLVVTAKMPLFLLVGLILGVIVIFWKDITKKQKAYLFIIMGVAAVITLMWALYAKDINTGAFWGKNVDTAQQLHYIAAHPLTFLKNLIYSILNYDYMNIVYGMYANRPHYTSMPFLVSVVVLLGLALSSFVNGEVRTLGRKSALYWTQVGLYVISTCAIFTLLYLQYTPIGVSSEIQGVQPRYFLPFIPLLLMTPYSLKLSSKWKIFVYVAPFIGVFWYLGYILLQIA